MHVYRKVALRAARSSDRCEKRRGPSRARHEIFPSAAAPRRQSVADGFLTRRIYFELATTSGQAGARLGSSEPKNGDCIRRLRRFPQILRMGLTLLTLARVRQAVIQTK